VLLVVSDYGFIKETGSGELWNEMRVHILDQLSDIKQAEDGAVRRKNVTAKHFARNTKARNMYTTNGTKRR
jgi:hypothetical protein